MPAATREGELLQALAFELPAARPYVTPEAIEFATAESRAELTPPPRLMFATAGLTALVVTQLTPAMTPALVPLPEQFSTRTPTSLTPLATPYVPPPTVPATCVPWPLQSSVAPPSTASTPELARPENSLCANRMPVSMMYAVT